MTQSVLIDKIKFEFKEFCTPDIATLRFRSERFKVFLYDELQDLKKIFDLCNVTTPSIFNKKSQVAVTEEEFHAFHNTDYSTFAYDCYMYSEGIDFSEVETTGECPAKKIMGSIVEVDLNGLIALDKYYYNGVTYQREEVKVKTSPSSVFKADTCFTYVSQPTATFTSTSVGDHRYVPARGIELTPFLETEKGYYQR